MANGISTKWAHAQRLNERVAIFLRCFFELICQAPGLFSHLCYKPLRVIFCIILKELWPGTIPILLHRYTELQNSAACAPRKSPQELSCWYSPVTNVWACWNCENFLVKSLACLKTLFALRYFPLWSRNMLLVHYSKPRNRILRANKYLTIPKYPAVITQLRW